MQICPYPPADLATLVTAAVHVVSAAHPRTCGPPATRRRITCGERCEPPDRLHMVAPMKLSTRNQLPGTVTSVTTGEAMAVVKIQLDGGAVLTSSITKEAAEDLGLAEGSKVLALVKSTEVALAVE